MRAVGIVQARMGSTRLPGKVLLPLAGAPMLAQQIRRLKRCRELDELVIAATVDPKDEPLLRVAEAEGVRWFRGSEQDVLGRYAGAAREAGADIVIRITSDCPLIDPEQSDRVVAELRAHSATHDYAANILARTFPRGLDTEAFTRDALERMVNLAASPAAREHVTQFLLKERPELFRTLSVTDTEDNSDLRWTVDTQEDLELIRRIYAALRLDTTVVSYRDTLRYVREHPELIQVNAHVRQKET